MRWLFLGVIICFAYSCGHCFEIVRKRNRRDLLLGSKTLILRTDINEIYHENKDWLVLLTWHIIHHFDGGNKSASVSFCVKVFHLQTCLVARNRQQFGFGLTGLALSKPNRLSLSRVGSFQTWIEMVPKLVHTSRLSLNRLGNRCRLLTEPPNRFMSHCWFLSI